MSEIRTSPNTSTPEEYHNENMQSMQPGEKDLHEKELAESEHFIRQIIDTSPVLILVTDVLSNKLIYINKTMEDLMGYSRTEVPTFNREEYVHPADKEVWNDLYYRTSKSQNDAVCEGEYRIKDTHGNYVWLHNKSTVFKRDEQGKAWQILSICTDVTEHKLAEERLIKLNLQVFEKNTFIETLVDANIDRIMAYDRNLNVIAWNKRCEEVYGIKKEEILGKPFFSFFPKLQEATPIKDAFNRSMNGQTAHIPVHKNIYSREYSELFYTPLKDAANNVTGVVTIIHDLTERIQAENQLMQLNTSLQAKNKEPEILNEELTTFAFIASHDLGEPLRKIQIFADRILKTEQPNLSPTGKDGFERILAGVKRMNALLNDVLSFSRISSGKKNFEKCELDQLLYIVKKEMADTLDQAGAIIESQPLPEIKCNKSHIILLFQNLLSNAIKYQKPGSKPVIQIECKLLDAGETNHSNAEDRKAYHKISFADNGIGFEAEYSDKIFQMFQRLHGTTEYPGTGIGLALCKKIMEAHKGFITAESTFDVGSVFTCYFPVEED
jgi:PAS domain S-box-containing protein